MKKTFLLASVFVTSIGLMACGSTTETADSVQEISAEAASTVEEASAQSTEESSTGLANPWSEITEDQAFGMVPNGFSAPEGATNVVWSMMQDGDEPLVQMTFDLDELSFTAREQNTSDETADISGMNYEWTVSEEIQLANWAGGEMTGTYSRYVSDSEYADLCTWYDVETGASYSLSVVAPDLDGFDLQAVAEAIYDPEKQTGAMIPEDEHEPFDITGCDTFTDIVNKLPAGYGYANVTVGDVDLLLVTEYTYDYDGNGNYAAIDADAFYYNDEGVPTFTGYVQSAGTAYPLTVSNGMLYVGGNHFVSRLIPLVGGMVVDEEAWVQYDSDGNATYYHHSDLREVEADEDGQVEDDSYMTALYDEMFEGEIVYFDVIQ